jgi:hypothetical protein
VLHRQRRSLVATPRVEIGGVVAGRQGNGEIGVDLRTSIRGWSRVSLDLGLEWMELLRERRDVDQLMWFYLWQVRWPSPLASW